MSGLTAQAVAMHAELVRQHGEMVLALLGQESTGKTDIPFGFLLAHSSVAEGWSDAEALEQQKKLALANATAAEGGNFLRGDLSKGELAKFAEDNGFTPELVNSLWSTFSSPRMQDFLREKRRKLTFTEDEEVRREDLERLFRMKSLEPGAFRTYGPKKHELLMGVLTAMFVDNAE